MKCFRHSESDAVGTCKYCFKGVCSACANDTGLGVVCSPQCEEEVRAIKSLVDRSKQAFPFAAKTHSRNAVLLCLFGAALIVFGLVARDNSFLFPFLLAFGTIMVLGAFFSVLTGRKYAKSSQS